MANSHDLVLALWAPFPLVAYFFEGAETRFTYERSCGTSLVVFELK
jgi:hypothetical protein